MLKGLTLMRFVAYLLTILVVGSLVLLYNLFPDALAGVLDPLATWVLITTACLFMATVFGFLAWALCEFVYQTCGFSKIDQKRKLKAQAEREEQRYQYSVVTDRLSQCEHALRTYGERLCRLEREVHPPVEAPRPTREERAVPKPKADFYVDEFGISHKALVPKPATDDEVFP